MLLSALCLYGQDPQFTQFYATPQYLNPALTGANADFRLSSGYRNQWSGLPRSYSTFILGAESYIPDYKAAIGLLLMADKAGALRLSNNFFGATGAYDIMLSRKWSAGIGLRAGYGWRSINMDNALFGDQIVNGSAVTISPPVVDKAGYMDFGSGLAVFSDRYLAGISFSHLSQPEVSMYGIPEKLPLKFSVHGSADISLVSGAGDGQLDEKPVLTLAFLYKSQKEYDQLDLGFYLRQKNLFTGIWYRGIPGFKAYEPGYPNHDMVAVLLGGKYKQFTFGYSFDFTVSGLTMASGGSHEVSVQYKVFTPVKKRKTKTKIIPCPKI